ncbi:MAG: thiamine ABC transporter substrate-binding protein [Anaerolineales bacterium]|nr:thiamine ABC transporter substrate-binding protein [Anaerolineales bacterium]
MTHDSFAVSESVLQQFEQAAGAKVIVLESGDTGAALNKAILTKAAPLADVFYGVDNTFLSRALEEGIFEPYSSPLAESISADFRLDPENRALPVDFGDVCINYDREWFSSQMLAVPQALEDLTLPEYEGLLAVENPYTSSPGLAFLLATVAHFGPEGFADFWKSLKANRAAVVDGWETAYYTNFSASSGKGPQPMVVSYASSPAFEFIYADPPRDEPPTASLTGPGMCFRQIEFAGILAGTPNRALAEKLVDFLLSVPFQEDIPLQMAVYPVNPQAALPEAFLRFAPLPETPAVLAPDEIRAHREEWMEAWKEIMLP